MRRSFSKLGILALGLGVWAGLGTGVAHGELLPVQVTTTQVGSSYDYSYSVVLTSDSSLHKGDYFTIYDFNGYVANSNQQSSGWTFSTSAVGPTPAGIVATDSPSVTNLTWTYTGDGTVNGQQNQGNFVAYSSYGTTTDGTFAANTHRQIDGKQESSITTTECPVPSSQTPEPATLVLAALALPLLGAGRWLRHRQVALAA